MVNLKRIVSVPGLSFYFNHPRRIRRRIRQILVLAIELGLEFRDADQALDCAHFLFTEGINKVSLYRWIAKNQASALNKILQKSAIKFPIHQPTQNVLSKLLNISALKTFIKTFKMGGTTPMKMYSIIIIVLLVIVIVCIMLPKKVELEGEDGSLYTGKTGLFIKADSGN